MTDTGVTTHFTVQQVDYIGYWISGMGKDTGGNI